MDKTERPSRNFEVVASGEKAEVTLVVAQQMLLNPDLRFVTDRRLVAAFAAGSWVLAREVL